MDWDVIVVGAGPAGCTAATLLAREGACVLLLEKASDPPPKVCGEYLSPGCRPILDRLGALAPLRAAGARPIVGMQVHTARGRSWRALYPQGREHPGPSHGLAVPRRLLDEVLLQMAIHSGVHFSPAFQASDLLWEQGRVVGIRGRQDGRVTGFRGRLVIGADGRNSVVARRVGVVRRLPWLDKVALVAHMEDVAREEDVGEIFLGADRYAILNPVGPALTNLGVVVSRRDLCGTGDPSSLLLATARTFPGLRERLASARLVGPARRLEPLAFRASRLSAPGCLLIGDAAGFLDPFTGEGILAGLRSGELAAHFAIAAQRRKGPDSPDLQAYVRAWEQEIAARWRLGALLQRVIRRPRLADWLVAVLAASPRLASRLMAATGDLLPPPHRQSG